MQQKSTSLKPVPVPELKEVFSNPLVVPSLRILTLPQEDVGDETSLEEPFPR